MSIPTAAMSILAEMPDPRVLLVVALVAAAVTGLAWMLGVFRRKQTLEFARVEPGEPMGKIWMIVLLGFGTYYLLPSFYLTLKQSVADPAQSPATAPATTAIEIAPPSTTAPSTSPAQADLPFAPTEMVALMLALNVVVIIVMILANLRSRPGGLQRMGIAPRMLGAALFPAVIAVLIVLPLTYLSAELTQWLWYLLRVEHPNAHMLLRIFGEQDAVLLHAMIILSAVVVAPIAEELLYRGHLQTAIVALMRELASPPDQPLNPRAQSTIQWAAIVATSLVFAPAHEIWMLPPIFFLSLCLGYVYERTQNLWVPILLHMTFNGANVTLFLLQSSG